MLDLMLIEARFHTASSFLIQHNYHMQILRMYGLPLITTFKR